MGALDLSLSLVGLGLEILLAATLVRRNLHREFPFFFTYVAFAILANSARLSVSGNYQMYFKIFWATATLYALFSLLALYLARQDRDGSVAGGNPSTHKRTAIVV